jgi:4'-phosphopantetheinyl transferase
VHVWIGSLGCPTIAWASLRAALSTDEASHARALPSAADRRRFLASRGQLRILLGRYQRTAPRAIRLGREPNGKPILEAPTGKPQLHFNVSHSGELVLYALTRAGAVGADVEQFRPNLDWHGVAARFFAAEEAAALGRVDGAGWADFYRLWTQKEAMAKAAGGSLFSWLGADLAAAVPTRWTVWSWHPPGAAASVAVSRAA